MSQNEFLFSDNDDKEDSTNPDPDGGSFKRKPDFFDTKSPTPKEADNPPKTTSTSRKKRKAVIYSVTQLNRLIKHVLNDNLPAKFVLTGEISNCTHHTSGHLYLTLKDENSSIASVMWKSASAKMKFRPEDGMAVIATGRVDVYEPQGKYQFYIDKLEPSGTGALELAFRQLADKLRQQGLFEQTHKKPLPKYPNTIVIVTSGTGAAIQDITQTLNRRFPIVRQLLYPVSVQGDAAAGEIAQAIRDTNNRRDQLGGIDLMIVGRGGGSLEDLWPFNEEIVARAIFDSQIPIISAVGHEIDTSIADMVADVRAATPTGAAELAVPVLVDILEDLHQQQSRLYHGIARHCQLAHSALEAIAGRSLFTRPLDLIANQRQLLDEKKATLSQCFTVLLRDAGRRVERYAVALRAIEPYSALARGRGRVDNQKHLLELAFINLKQKCHNQLSNIAARHLAGSPVHRVGRFKMLIDQLANRLARGEKHLTRHQRQMLDGIEQRLQNLDPRGVLKRGYSITRLKSTGRLVAAEDEIKPGDVIVTELDKNRIIESEVSKTSEPK